MSHDVACEVQPDVPGQVVIVGDCDYCGCDITDEDVKDGLRRLCPDCEAYQYVAYELALEAEGE